MPGLVPNARSRKIEESATLAISAQAARMKQRGLDVVSLGAGEPDFPTPAPIAAAGIAAIEQGNTRYTPAPGTTELRAAGARWLERSFGIAYTQDEVMVCAGAKGALHMALDAIVEPGDPVLILAPYWVSYPALVTIADGVPIVLRAVPEQGFVHTAATIAAAAERHRARGMLLNFPNNPSGVVPTRAQMQSIVDVARAHDMWIVSDEIYATLLYDGAAHVSPAALPGGRERTVLVNGFTKSHSLTGWRTSFMAAPQPVIAAASRIQSQVLGNACTISQAAMLAACELDLPDERSRRMRAFDERRRYLVAEIARIPGLALTPPRGAFYALVDARELCARRGIDDVAMCEQLLERHLLAAVPGSAFAIPGFVRLSYAAEMPLLQKAVERLRAYAEQP
ncbi:MAG TPA: pyridoxal phosphate-dependent aminotransferase [Planctomycetota bacterium]|nr:pyridoxal phosphate-dependent aminotransferase [Planctomycetota bacterium]